MQRRQVVIGLDVGTTATKAVAFGIGVGALQTAVHEYPLLNPQTGWHVQDGDVVLHAVTRALAQCVQALGDTVVLAVSLSTASHALVALDDSLRPLTQVITWADMRAREQVSRLRASGMGAQVYAASATPVHSMTPLSKLLWFGEHEPALLASARWWADLKALVVARLTGTVATDLSSASTTGLLDVAGRDWSSDLATLCGVRLDQLPPVLPTTQRLALLPEVADAAGLRRDCPLVIGAADGPLGNLGIGATDPGVVGVSIGTSGAARVVVPQPTLDPQGRLFCYALTDHAWVLGGAISNGGSVLRWVGELLGPQDAPGSPPSTDDDLLALAEGVPAGSEGLVMLPYLLPERAPLWDPYLPGAVLGLRARHTRGHLVRAAVEGVALQLALVVDDLLRLTPVTAVRATGGVFRARLWGQVVADALGRRVEVSDPVGGTALGAAALAVHSLGLVEDLASAPGLLAPGLLAPGLLAPGLLTPGLLAPDGTDDGAGSSGSPRVVEPDPDGMAAFAGMRASVRPLLASYGAVADLLHDARPADGRGQPPGVRDG